MKRIIRLTESDLKMIVKRVINESTQCGNYVPLVKSPNNLTITADGEGAIIVNGKLVFRAWNDLIVGEEIDIKNNKSAFKPGEYILQMCKGWGWLVNKSNGSWNGFIIKSDEIKGAPTRCGYIIFEKEVVINRDLNIEGLSSYSVHNINYANGTEGESNTININDKNLQSIPKIVIESDAPELRVIGGTSSFTLKNDRKTTYEVNFSNILGGVNITNGAFVSWYVVGEYEQVMFKGLNAKPGSIFAGFQDLDTKTQYLVYTNTKGMVLKHVVNL